MKKQPNTWMNNIDFVNGVYDRVKAPFHSVMNMVQQTTNPLEMKFLEGWVSPVWTNPFSDEIKYKSPKRESFL